MCMCAFYPLSTISFFLVIIADKCFDSAMVRSDRSESDGAYTPPRSNLISSRENRTALGPSDTSRRPRSVNRSSRRRPRHCRSSSTSVSSTELERNKRNRRKRRRRSSSSASRQRIRWRARTYRCRRDHSLSDTSSDETRGRTRYRTPRRKSNSPSYERSSRRRRRRHSRRKQLSTDEECPDMKKRCMSSKSKVTDSISSNKVENTDVSFFRKFLDIMNDKCNSSTFMGAQNVIPAFDPGSKIQTAKDWLRKVNETASIYNWQERQIIYHALPKLAGLAKRWYEGLSTVDLSWAEWQAKILNTFPDDRNYGDKLSEMLERKSRRDETLEEYYYDKITLINVCGITGKDAVDCVIHGIFDNNIRLNAQGSNFQNPTELLKFLRSISNRSIAHIKRPVTSARQPNFVESSGKDPNDSNRFKNLKCYNCSDMGHTVVRCPKPLKKCSKCSRLGHDQENCSRFTSRISVPPNKPEINNQPLSTSQKVLKITSANTEKTDKYVKFIKINGSDHTAYIDFGSQCSLIKNSVANSKNLILSKTNLPVLKGFAFGSVLPVGKVNINVKVDAVSAEIEAYVVDDSLLNNDMLIGQSLTELPSVVAFKTTTDLYLYTDSSLLTKVQLYSSDDANINGVGILAVHANSNVSGLVYVPECLCTKDKEEYIILQGLYPVENGQGHIIIVNLSGNNIKFEKDKLLSRANLVPVPASDQLKMNEVPLENIHKIDVTCLNIDTETSTPSKDITLDMLKIGDKVAEKDKLRLLALLNEYRDCFALSVDELGLTPITEMHIKLTDDSPVSYKPYRLPFAERKIVRDMIDNLLANDIVRESNSPFASPIVLVRKKNNDYRLCVDYRALNKKTIKDRYPMPVIDDQLDRLSGKKYFTSLDLASGYHQIPVAESSRHLTAFVTPDGHYEYTRMPFGLVNAPAVFQQMINKALGPKRFELAIPYLDDLLSAASNIEESLEKLESILNLLRGANLTLNLNKCHFLQSSIDYLGYEISENGLKPGIKKTQAVSDFPTPVNVHQVRQFVGLASFFRRFVYKFASIARPLTQLTKTDISWTWGPEQQSAFDEIKARLVSRPVLALYNPEYITEVHCDASKVGMGAILLQKVDETSPLRPVAYYSRQTTKDEQFLHSYELETMAVVAAMKKFRVYLIGLQFKVLTDCSALRATLSKRDLVPRIARWWLQLQEFDFTVEYRPGHNMQHADALSRNPLSDEDLPSLEIMNIRTEDWLHTVQMTDPKLRHIKDILKTEDSDMKDIVNNYILKNDRLYRKVGNSHKWVVPNGARWRICQLSHDEAGHFAFEKTFEKISSEYWFPKMKRFIKKYVAACMNCAYNKRLTGKETGYLHPIPKVNEIFHTIHLDHLGPFIKSKTGNVYILGIIDSFSKFIFVKGVRNTKSRTTIKVLEDIFATFGSPKVIITDQGTSFTSAEFKQFIVSIGSKHVLNAVATPRANGQIERYNRTILNSLASMNHDRNEADWDLNLPKLQWSLNNTLNKAIGKSPAEVVFGHRTTNPQEGIIRVALDDETVAEKESQNEDSRLNIRESVDATIKNKQRAMKESFDKKRAPTKFFKEGDLVMIPNYCQERGKSTKLAPKFRGPFKVTAVLDKDRYEVSSVEGHSSRKYKNVFPADHLKSWITFHSSPTESESDNESD